MTRTTLTRLARTYRAGREARYEALYTRGLGTPRLRTLNAAESRGEAAGAKLARLVREDVAAFCEALGVRDPVPLAHAREHAAEDTDEELAEMAARAIERL